MPGFIDVSVADLRLPSDSERGSGAHSGFLYSVMFTAVSVGSGTITASAGAGGTVLFNPSLNPAGVPTFAPVGLAVVVTGSRRSVSG